MKDALNHLAPLVTATVVTAGVALWMNVQSDTPPVESTAALTKSQYQHLVRPVTLSQMADVLLPPVLLDQESIMTPSSMSVCVCHVNMALPQQQIVDVKGARVHPESDTMPILGGVNAHPARYSMDLSVPTQGVGSCQILTRHVQSGRTNTLTLPQERAKPQQKRSPLLTRRFLLAGLANMLDSGADGTILMGSTTKTTNFGDAIHTVRSRMDSNLKRDNAKLPLTASMDVVDSRLRSMSPIHIRWIGNNIDWELAISCN